jgi:hypothetical protein
MLGDILAGFQLFDRFKKNLIKSNDENKTTSLPSRLVALFESHGVHRNQIPEFFGHGLDIPSCASDEKLLDKITPEIIHDAVVLFGVNKDWLEGSSKEIYDIPDFYKHPEEFAHYLIELLKNTSKDKLFAYVLTSNKKLMNGDYDSLFVIAESIGGINQREIYKYHLIGRWVIHYWKSRAYFTACCALLYKHGISVAGKVVERHWLTDIDEGHKLLDYDFTERCGGIDIPTVGMWIVSDFVEMPDQYLEGMDTEQGRAIPLAIGKWLDLNEKGYMRCFPEDNAFHEGVETLFKEKIGL